MKAVRVNQWGGPQAAVIEDIDRPEVGPNEVLIQVKAVSINPFDWSVREGYLQGYMSLPLTLGSDVAGDIEAVGDTVEGFRVGDPVYGMAAMVGGAFADYVKLPASHIAHKPDTLSYLEAAAVPHAAIAAWQALRVMDLQPGQRLLIHAAAGGVGHFAVQFAKLRGLYVIGTASAHNETFLRGLGVDEFIDYTAVPFETVIQDVDAVLDSVGYDTTSRSFQVIKPNGIMVCIVTPPDEAQAAQHKVRVNYLGGNPNTDDLSAIGQLIDDGKVKPHVSQILPFDQVFEALHIISGHHVRGKLVLDVEKRDA